MRKEKEKIIVWKREIREIYRGGQGNEKKWRGLYEKQEYKKKKQQSKSCIELVENRNI